MTTEPNEFTPAELAEIAAHEKNARIVLGIDKPPPGQEVPAAPEPPKVTTPDEYNRVHGLAALKEAGLSDQVIDQIDTGRTVTAAERQMVADWKAAHMKDAEFTKKLPGGDVDANRQMLLANVTLSAEIEKK
jgi:hypothetical protein